MALLRHSRVCRLHSLQAGPLCRQVEEEARKNAKLWSGSCTLYKDLSVRRCIYLSIYLPVHLFLYLSICLYVYTQLYLQICILAFRRIVYFVHLSMVGFSDMNEQPVSTYKQTNRQAKTPTVKQWVCIIYACLYICMYVCIYIYIERDTHIA